MRGFLCISIIQFSRILIFNSFYTLYMYFYTYAYRLPSIPNKVNLRGVPENYLSITTKAERGQFLGPIQLTVEEHRAVSYSHMKTDPKPSAVNGSTWKQKTAYNKGGFWSYASVFAINDSWIIESGWKGKEARIWTWQQMFYTNLIFLR